MGDTIFGNKSGGDNIAGNKFELHVPQPTPAATTTRRTVILLLSADSDASQPLRLDEERRAIDNEVAHSRAAACLEVRTADAVRLDDLSKALLRHRPSVVHFSGHGHPTDGIQVVDPSGWPRAVPPAALSDLFRILSAGLRCVVLNACHTEKQAAAIARHVPCVIGMRRQVLDNTSILFATAFYRGIADGQPLDTSFELGRNALLQHGVPDRDTPRLIARSYEAYRPIVDTE
jgi:hypothetical protein